MATYGEMTYMCLDVLKEHSDDAYYTEEHIMFLLKKIRALLLNKKYKPTRNGVHSAVSQENAAETEATMTSMDNLTSTMQQLAEKAGGLADAAALDVEGQIRREEPVVHQQPVVRGPAGQIVQGHALVAPVRQHVHEQAVEGRQRLLRVHHGLPVELLQPGKRERGGFPLKAHRQHHLRILPGGKPLLVDLVSHADRPGHECRAKLCAREAALADYGREGLVRHLCVVCADKRSLEVPRDLDVELLARVRVEKALEEADVRVARTADPGPLPVRDQRKLTYPGPGHVPVRIYLKK